MDQSMTFVIYAAIWLPIICLYAWARFRQDEVRNVVVAALERRLGDLNAPAAEGALVDRLRAENVHLRVAVAAALGKVASVAAVLPLSEASERFGEREFRREARQAIAAIQARVPGDAAGRVSLPVKEAAGGRLSMATAETGELSLVEAKDDGGARWKS